MTILDWGMLVIPLLFLATSVFYTKRHMRSVTDFLAAGRTARRYLLTSANGLAGYGLITLVAGTQVFYHAGWAVSWWNNAATFVLAVLCISGYVTYRFRETRALTMGQYFEMRFSRKYRIFMGVICWLSGIINYGIFPAVAANFFITFLRLPPTLCGISTFPLLMFLFLGGALLIAATGGQIQNIVSDTIQSIFCYGMSIAVAITILLLLDKAAFHEVLTSQPAGESYINPFDTAGVKDLNFWWIMINIYGCISGYGAWQGNQGYAVSALTPHEAKMGGILSTWRMISVAFFAMMLSLGGLTVAKAAAFTEISQEATAYLSQNFIPATADQMTLTTCLAAILPVGIKGMLVAVMFFLMLSTDTSYLHSWGSILVQDVIIPTYGKRIPQKTHLWLIRLSMVLVALFAFCFSTFYRQSEYIQLFQMLTGCIFAAGAGCAILGGLYWKKGTTQGVWAASLLGVCISLGNVVLLDARGWHAVREFLLSFFPQNQTLLEAVDRCPVNAAILSFSTTVLAQITFVLVSLCTCKKDYNLDKLLHRGQYADQDTLARQEEEKKDKAIPWHVRFFLGFDQEFTLSDKVVALSVSLWTYGWAAAFFLITLWNVLAYFLPGISQWSPEWWFNYFWFFLLANLVLAPVTALWMAWGSIRDIFFMFKLLKTRKTDETDDGMVDPS